MENEIIINGVTYVRKEEKKQSKRGKSWWGLNGSNIEEYTGYLEESEKPFNYPTEAEAIKARDKMLAIYRIKEYCNEQWGEFIPDWSDLNQLKYYIYYSHNFKEFSRGCESCYQYTDQMYLADHSHCEEIIEKFKDDLDILFDVKGK